MFWLLRLAGQQAALQFLPALHGVALLAARAKLGIVHVIAAVATDAGGRNGRNGFVGGCCDRMTVLAGELLMSTLQRVFGLSRVVKVPQAPGPRVVAALAVLPQSLLVRVFLFVAGITLALRILEALCGVAALAGCNAVSAGQRVTCAGMVKPGDLPGAVAMALLACRSLLPFVFVVLFVAAQAFQRRVTQFVQPLVAATALDRAGGVGVLQGKACAIVVKAALRGFPVLLAVACATVVSQGAQVLVFFLVAGDATLRRFLEQRTPVALLAFGLGVTPQERETCGIVIELGRLGPVALAVTACAVLAQSLFMLVVLAVTTDTLGTKLGAIQRPGVTVGAGAAAVFAAQGVARVGVVVEGTGFPSLGAMAAVALVTKLATVALAAVVVLAVTTDAVAWSLPIVAGLVAVRTLDVLVLAGEHKTRGAVVEFGILPVVLVVTISTLLAQRFLVCIVLLVAYAALG